MWKVGEITTESEKGTYSLCQAEEDTVHILLKCTGTREQKGELFCQNCLEINKKSSCGKTVSYTDKFIFRI